LTKSYHRVQTYIVSRISREIFEYGEGSVMIIYFVAKNDNFMDELEGVGPYNMVNKSWIVPCYIGDMLS